MKRFALLLLACASTAIAGGPQDFRAGIELTPEPGHPVAELSLPDAVYGGIARAGLDDVGVFNAQGTPVPHAFCAAPAYGPAPQAPERQALPLFPLQTAKDHGGGTSVQVIGRDGTTVAIRPSGEPLSAQAKGATEVAAWVIDARATRAPLSALRVRWHTADGASELHVRVEASEDLDQWQVLVPQTTLVHAAAGEQSLERGRIPLPVGPRSYLRLARNGSGPAPVLEEVQAEFAAPSAPATAPRWIETATQTAPPNEPGYFFDAQRLAPMEFARIELPAPNMSLEVALQSRADAKQPWRTVWSGAVYQVVSGELRKRSEDPAFAADTDRYWRIQVLRNAETLGSLQPALSLGYRPALLRFLAQGEGPFTLAYGSGRVTQRANCDSLLQGLPPAELQNLISHEVKLGTAQTLGGEAAMQPAAQPHDTRPILLWGLLLLGAAAVAWMALSLLGKLRP